MKKTCLFLASLILLIGCNRNDKPSTWEGSGKHPKPLQEGVVSDTLGPATQASGDQLPAGHPPIETPATGSGEALPPGHPPIANVADSSDTTSSDAGSAEAAKVEVNDMHWTAPKGWIRKQPASPIIQAEFKLPRANDDPADGRLTISTARGGLEANIARWRGQFGGKPEKDTTEHMEVAGLKITLVDLQGTFKDSGGGPMMGGPAIDRPNYRMLGAVIPRGDTSFFVKAYGPAKTMAAHADEVKAFLKSMKVEK